MSRADDGGGNVSLGNEMPLFSGSRSLRTSAASRFPDLDFSVLEIDPSTPLPDSDPEIKLGDGDLSDGFVFGITKGAGILLNE